MLHYYVVYEDGFGHGFWAADTEAATQYTEYRAKVADRGRIIHLAEIIDHQD